MAAIIMKLQVQHSRLASDAARYRGRVFFRTNGVQWMIDAADLHHEVVSLFEYARDIGALRKRAPADRLRSALMQAGLHNDDHPAHVEVERLAAVGDTPSTVSVPTL
jgi:hypothetical protein